MNIIEIAPLNNGAHRNQNGSFSSIPNGWAIVPDNMVCENFPFGKVEVEEINGVMTVTSWIPTEVPKELEIVLSPVELREQAYNIEKIIAFNNSTYTVTEATTLWQYYAAEGSDKATELTALIAKAKEEIRTKYHDIK